eukprot:1172382-Ditylum_brightwellii.AAC.1
MGERVAKLGNKLQEEMQTMIKEQTASAVQDMKKQYDTQLASINKLIKTIQATTKELTEATKDITEVAHPTSYSIDNINHGVYITHPIAQVFAYEAPCAPFPMHIS